MSVSSAELALRRCRVVDETRQLHAALLSRSISPAIPPIAHSPAAQPALAPHYPSVSRTLHIREELDRHHAHVVAQQADLVASEEERRARRIRDTKAAIQADLREALTGYERTRLQMEEVAMQQKRSETVSAELAVVHRTLRERDEQISALHLQLEETRHYAETLRTEVKELASLGQRQEARRQRRGEQEAAELGALRKERDEMHLRILALEDARQRAEDDKRRVEEEKKDAVEHRRRAEEELRRSEEQRRVLTDERRAADDASRHAESERKKATDELERRSHLYQAMRLEGAAAKRKEDKQRQRAEKAEAKIVKLLQERSEAPEEVTVGNRRAQMLRREERERLEELEERVVVLRKEKLQRDEEIGRLRHLLEERESRFREVPQDKEAAALRAHLQRSEVALVSAREALQTSEATSEAEVAQIRQQLLEKQEHINELEGQQAQWSAQERFNNEQLALAQSSLEGERRARREAEHAVLSAKEELLRAIEAAKDDKDGEKRAREELQKFAEDTRRALEEKKGRAAQETSLKEQLGVSNAVLEGERKAHAETQQKVLEAKKEALASKRAAEELQKASSAHDVRVRAQGEEEQRAKRQVQVTLDEALATLERERKARQEREAQVNELRTALEDERRLRTETEQMASAVMEAAEASKQTAEEMARLSDEQRAAKEKEQQLREEERRAHEAAVEAWIKQETLLHQQLDTAKASLENECRARNEAEHRVAAEQATAQAATLDGSQSVADLQQEARRSKEEEQKAREETHQAYESAAKLWAVQETLLKEQLGAAQAMVESERKARTEGESVAKSWTSHETLLKDQIGAAKAALESEHKARSEGEQRAAEELRQTRELAAKQEAQLREQIAAAKASLESEHKARNEAEQRAAEGGNRNAVDLQRVSEDARRAQEEEQRVRAELQRLLAASQAALEMERKSWAEKERMLSAQVVAVKSDADKQRQELEQMAAGVLEAAEGQKRVGEEELAKTGEEARRARDEAVCARDELQATYDAEKQVWSAMERLLKEQVSTLRAELDAERKLCKENDDAAQGDAARNLALAEEAAKHSLENERRAKGTITALEKCLHDLEEQMKSTAEVAREKEASLQRSLFEVTDKLNQLEQEAAHAESKEAANRDMISALDELSLEEQQRRQNVSLELEAAVNARKQAEAVLAREREEQSAVLDKLRQELDVRNMENGQLIAMCEQTQKRDNEVVTALQGQRLIALEEELEAKSSEADSAHRTAALQLEQALVFERQKQAEAERVLRTELETLKKDLVAARQQLERQAAATDAKKDALVDDNSNAKGAQDKVVQSLQKELEALKKDLAAKEQERKALARTKDDLTLRLSAMSASLDAPPAAVVTAGPSAEEWGKAQAEREALKQALAEQSEFMQTVMGQMESSVKEAGEKEQQYEQASGALALAQRRISELEKKLEGSQVMVSLDMQLQMQHMQRIALLEGILKSKGIALPVAVTEGEESLAFASLPAAVEAKALIIATPTNTTSALELPVSPVASPATSVAESIALLTEVKVPAGYDPEKYAKCKALYNFTARAVYELTFKAGDSMRMWEDRGDDWCLGEVELRAGYFPGNYVQRTKQAPVANKSGMLHGNVSPQIQHLAVMAGLLDEKKLELEQEQQDKEEKEKECAKPAAEKEEPPAVPADASSHTSSHGANGKQEVPSLPPKGGDDEFEGWGEEIEAEVAELRRDPDFIPAPVIKPAGSVVADAASPMVPRASKVTAAADTEDFFAALAAEPLAAKDEQIGPGMSFRSPLVRVPGAPPSLKLHLDSPIGMPAPRKDQDDR